MFKHYAPAEYYMVDFSSYSTGQTCTLCLAFLITKSKVTVTMFGM